MSTEAYEIVKKARSSGRYTGIDFIKGIFNHFFELHGDRRYADDSAVIGGVAYLDNMPVTVIAIEKGRIVRDETGMYGYKEALEDATSAFDTMPMNSRGTFKAGFRRGGRS